MECLYRYFDPWLEEGTINLERFSVKRHTPKGVWLHIIYGEEKFVLNEGRKRFAVETIELARGSFIRRKQRQISLLKGSLERAEKSLGKALNNEFNDLGYIPSLKGHKKRLKTQE